VPARVNSSRFYENFLTRYYEVITRREEFEYKLAPPEGAVDVDEVFFGDYPMRISVIKTTAYI